MKEFEPIKLDKETTDGTVRNLDALYQLFPSCFTEAPDALGEVHRAVDWGKLRELLGEYVEDGEPEKYDFTWVGKRAAQREAAAPCRKTLRPCPEESIDWDTTQNLYIEGDNLEVLKLLQNSYMGKVKMIYIDPPYNTGNDFVYHDDFAQSANEYDEHNLDDEGNRYRKNTDSNGRFHSDWCSMMYSRLLVARSLLTEDGAIFISIDDNEVENLSKICNEIYGEQNHLCTICVKNDSRARPYDSISITHEYLLVYKRDLFVSNQLNDKTKKFQYKDSLGGYDLYELRNRNSDFNVGNRPNLYYPFWVNPDNELEDNLYEIDLVEHEGWIMFYPQESQGIKTVWRWGKDRAQENLNTVIFGRKAVGGWQVVKKYRDDTYSLPSVWDDANVSSDRGTLTLKKYFNNKRIFSFPKSPDLISRCLEIASSKDSIIMDFFSGSASTAHAIIQKNNEDDGKRKFILVQLPESTEVKSEAYKAGYKNICEIGKERIRRAGKKILEEQKAKQGDLFSGEQKNLDIGFRVLKCDESNYKPVAFAPKDYTQESLDMFLDNIKEERTGLDLLFDCMMRWGLELSLPYETQKVDGCTIYNVDDGNLVACFDGVVTSAVIDAIAETHPLRVVFRDSSFTEAAQKMNLFELFKQKCGWTDQEVQNNVRVI